MEPDLMRYALHDSFDGRCLGFVRNVSSRRLARQHAKRYQRETLEDFDLVEYKPDGSRVWIAHYQGRNYSRNTSQ